ncbi:MAG: GNAT family N-acetyltransferase, partial [Saprospiraceae bacterium]|nr:GNAT family N-acetyltransferase [Saprospiraceae bacterium]
MKRIESEKIKSNAAFYADLTRSNWSPIIQPSGTGDEYWDKLFQYFPDHQLFYETFEGEWLGFANTIPIHYNQPLSELPEEGWDWLLERGIKGYEDGISPNTLGGLQIGVNPKFRGKGWSKKILEHAKKSMQEYGYKQFILPIRPTLKDQHPEVPMEEYMTWIKDEKIYDPWIRTHLNAGAEII